MSNKWNRKKRDTRPRANDGKDNDRVLMMDIIEKREQEKIRDSIPETTIPKKTFINKLTDMGFIGYIGLFIIVILVIIAYIQVTDERDPITIKLAMVDNYSNVIRDECGFMYKPVNPQLSTSITTDQKEKDKSAPAIILNETDVYDAYIISSPLTRRSAQMNQITGFKLIDPSKYIKNC